MTIDDPDSVEALIEAAFAHDHAGRARDALRYYDRAYELGVPEARRRHFLVGYGSTLRAVGRADGADAVVRPVKFTWLSPACLCGVTPCFSDGLAGKRGLIYAFRTSCQATL